jgi:hypothetical protein
MCIKIISHDCVVLYKYISHPTVGASLGTQCSPKTSNVQCPDTLSDLDMYTYVNKDCSLLKKHTMTDILYCLCLFVKRMRLSALEIVIKL